jgi:methionine synthase I (cobalamin-dependent)
MGTMIRATSCGRDFKAKNDLPWQTHPRNRKIYSGYIAASAEIIETNTFTDTSIAQADDAMREYAVKKLAL